MVQTLAQPHAGSNPTWALVGLGVVLMAACFQILLGRHTIHLWVQCAFSGAPIPLGTLLRLRMKRLNVRAIAINWISARKSRLGIDLSQLIAHVEAGGNVTKVVRSMIAAKGAKEPFSWAEASGIERAGRDPMKHIQDLVDSRPSPEPSRPRPRETMRPLTPAEQDRLRRALQGIEPAPKRGLWALYRRARALGASVGPMALVGMSLRKVDAKEVLSACVRAAEEGIELPVYSLETHVLAGGDVEALVSILIAAKRARLAVSPDVARALELARKPPWEAMVPIDQ